MVYPAALWSISLESLAADRLLTGDGDFCFPPEL